jgi:hypothetical protein
MEKKKKSRKKIKKKHIGYYVLKKENEAHYKNPFLGKSAELSY